MESWVVALVSRRTSRPPHPRSIAEPPGAALSSPLVSPLSPPGRSNADSPFFLTSEDSMTKRALKRMVREGAFDADQFEDGKVRRLPVERGWAPTMHAMGAHPHGEEREQGYLKTIKPKSIGQARLIE